MKLATKLTFTVILVIAFAIVGGGFSLVEVNYQQAIRAEERTLDNAAKKIESSPDGLSAALVAADDYGKPVTVAFMTNDGNITTMVESSVRIYVSPDAPTLARALKSTVDVKGSVEYLLRAVQMADEDYVLIASSIEDLDHEHQTNLLTLGIVSLITILVGGLFITFMIRRDMRSVIRTLEVSANQERETRQSMQDFMGDASHELRTPLTVIKGYAELLAGNAETDPAQRQKAYARIAEQVDRMDETISSLLQLAEVGSISPNSFVAVDLQKLVSEAASDLKAMDAQRQISVDLEAVSIQGSAELLNRLLGNAIGNIHRHTPADAPVRFSLNRAGRTARLVIEDGGPGLPESAYSTGIQGFRRFDDSRSRETGGTGLGMTIMNSIVQAHSGTLQLGPSSLGGLKLDIALPLN
ncbi:MAG: hypothetical protein RLZZ164_555 [Actinomycetota bacterium]|jgi:signal transduction histidine kinase